MREPFQERIDKRPVVCDGAMGTMLYAKGIAMGQCFDALNGAMPQLVKEVHLAYVKAGAEVIETNTFGANKFRLEKFGVGEKVRELNLAGARLAREVAGDDLYVAGAVGPLGVRLEPLGLTSREEARAAFREQITVLMEGGADLIIVETMMDLEEAHQALLAAREVGTFPVIVQMTVQDDGSTPTGTRPEDFARALDELGRGPDRRQLQRRPRGRAGNPRAHCGGDGEEAFRAAQRRYAAHRRGPQPLSLLPGIHGELRAAIYPGGRAPGGGMLRHHARAHQSHQSRRALLEPAAGARFGGGPGPARPHFAARPRGRPLALGGEAGPAGVSRPR